ncbi:MAG TPA: OmpA family protein [Thermoanaerobaculia bacterium]|nr:OmpA family protein [Thermoanaerobaculia bacterium]
MLRRPRRRRLNALYFAALLVASATLTVRAARADDAKPGEPPKGNWQTPGEIQQPKGTWQVPGEIQKPGEIQRVEERCRHRLVVAADALFAFDQDTLSTQAEATLAVLGPQLAKEKGAVTVEGHTDAKGGDDYNQKLSERRARAVRDWLAAHHHLAAGTTAIGYGESKPLAPNAKPDGSDDPAGRAKNRRVEVVIATCPAPG